MNNEEIKYIQSNKREDALDEVMMKFNYEITNFFSAKAILDSKRNYPIRVIQRYFDIFGNIKTAEELYNLFKNKARLADRRKR